MRKEYYISTDKSLINIDFVHDYISKTSYWGKGRTIQQTKESIENSFCFGLYTKSNQQLGFARVVTDFVFFGNIMDVIIDPLYQGKGLGDMLVTFMLHDMRIKGLQTITLKTKNAHAFYGKYGFKKIGDSTLYMSKDKQILE